MGQADEFKVFTVGWEPSFIDYFIVPVQEVTGIDYVHGLVGDAIRVEYAQKRYPGSKFFTLSKRVSDPLPAHDMKLLASLEGVGVPTVRSMIQGDRVLRHLPEIESLGYATLVATRLKEELERHRPNVVLASHDSLHSAMSLAVAKSLDIPWVSLAFTVVPDNLTGFCNALTPNSLVPILRNVDDELRDVARLLMQKVRSKNQQILAYKAPTSFMEWMSQSTVNAKNFLRRRSEAESLGIDKYTYPTVGSRIRDIVRRTVNLLRLPVDRMLRSPPDGRYVYYPFHMAPESMLDTWAPFYQNQLAFVAQLSLAVPADTTFVIKLHFSDPDNYSRQQLRQLMNLPGLRIAHPDALGSAFIENAALVVGIQGTSCLEAALLGKPVLIFGDSPYQHFPRTERAKRPDELYEQISRMLDQPRAADDQILESFVKYMARYMPGRINDWSRPISEDEVKRYAECFVRLKNYITSMPINSSWYNVPPFVCR